MTYKPFRCELTVLIRYIYLAMKGMFTQRTIFLIWIALLIPYYVLIYFVSFWAGIVYISFLIVVLIWIIHDGCVAGYWTHEITYRKEIKTMSEEELKHIAKLRRESYNLGVYEGYEEGKKTGYDIGYQTAIHESD